VKSFNHNRVNELMPTCRSDSRCDDSIDWEKADQELGVAVPPDYKAFIEDYGCGVVSEFLKIFSPFSTVPGLNIFGQGKKQNDFLMSLRSSNPIRRQMPAFPAVPGLVPWGVTIDGDAFYWLVTSSNPLEWGIHTHDDQKDSSITFGLSFITFLSIALEGNLDLCTLPESFSVDGQIEYFKYDRTWNRITLDTP
jgi:hypothetical protein